MRGANVEPEGGHMQPTGKDAGQRPTTSVETPEHNDMHQSIDANTDLRLNARAQVLIGQRLKTIYNELVQEPVPEHLLKLLEELERKEGKE